MNLFAHQERAVEIARDHPRYAFWWECGTGKTMALLAICAERPMKTCVVCPKAIIDAAWLTDAQHFPSLRVVNGRKGIDRDGWDVIVLNYEPFKAHWRELVTSGVRRLVFDESSALKNPKSQQTRAAMDAAEHIEECYLLSGTPAPNGPHEYYGQLACVDLHTSANFYRWANQWLTPVRRELRDRTVIASWRMREDRRAEFERQLRERAWFLTKQECVDLPEQTDQYHLVDLSPTERRAYNTMRERLIAEWDGRTIPARLGAEMMKLRQLTGGWCYLSPDARVADYGRSKLDALRAALEEIGPQPVVIWAEFRHDIDRIVADLGPTAHAIDGRTTDGDRRAAFAAFGTDECRYLVCHPKAVGHGVTLVQACYAVRFGNSYSYELYTQSTDRIHRIGQQWPCTQIHLIAVDTCDWAVLKTLQRKGSASDAMRAALGCNMSRTIGKKTQLA